VKIIHSIYVDGKTLNMADTEVLRCTLSLELTGNKKSKVKLGYIIVHSKA